MKFSVTWLKYSIIIIGIILTSTLERGPSAAQGPQDPVLPTNTPRLPTPVPTAAIDAEQPSRERYEMISVPVDKLRTEETGPLLLESFTFQRQSHSLGTVTAIIRNTSKEPRDGSGWYILSPQGSGKPWEHIAYQSPILTVQELEPNSAVVFQFAGPPSDIVGVLQISLWVHTIDPGIQESVHSDGVLYPSPLPLGPELFISITYARLTVNAEAESSGENAVIYVTFSTHNYRDSSAHVALSFSVSPVGTADPLRTSVFNAPFETLVLAPQESRTVTFRQEFRLPRGRYQVTGWLHEVTGNTSEHVMSVTYRNLLGF